MKRTEAIPNFRPAPEPFDTLNHLGGEPLLGSGFEHETPEPGFDERS
jgi:hypothetical protein